MDVAYHSVIVATFYITFSFGYHNLKINELQYKSILFSKAKLKQSLYRHVKTLRVEGG
jgi:hypothetical protein